MSNLMAHARRELEAAGYSEHSIDPLDKGIWDNTLKIVQAFADCGHSGSSAVMHTVMIHQLLQFKSLGPVTDNPEDWVEVGPEVWQYRRESCMFSDDGGKTYHDVNKPRRGWRRKLLGVWKSRPSQPHRVTV